MKVAHASQYTGGAAKSPALRIIFAAPFTRLSRE
jgi:hypothetical protein